MSSYREQVGSQVQERTEHLEKQLSAMLEAKRKGEAEVASRLKDLRARMDKMENLERQAIQLSGMIR